MSSASSPQVSATGRDATGANRPPRMTYCRKCVYPRVAVNLAIDDEGVCMGCRVAAQKHEIDWDARRAHLGELLEQYRHRDGSHYDCIIPVSGGKDSYFQTHIIKNVFGLNPLLVTYHGNNYTPTGERNLLKMRERLGVDHIIFGPSVTLLKKLNRLCFRMMGDMNWHAHCGIFTYPVQIAVSHRIPLLIWGEHGFLDLAGQFSLYDMVEMTARCRLEHAQRGFDWFDMLDPDEGITAKDLLWARYPSDDELLDVGVRGIYLGNFVPWEANQQTELIIREYGWEPSPVPFERTYRRISNLDDMHENGIHDYLKYIKFGYGRATDHASKDIRAGRMTREEGIAMVRKHDHIRSSDLYRWLDYVDMTEEEFDRIANTFRDPRVWWRDAEGRWCKDNIWDEEPA